MYPSSKTFERSSRPIRTLNPPSIVLPLPTGAPLMVPSPTRPQRHGYVHGWRRSLGEREEHRSAALCPHLWLGLSRLDVDVEHPRRPLSRARAQRVQVERARVHPLGLRFLRLDRLEVTIPLKICRGNVRWTRNDITYR